MSKRKAVIWQYFTANSDDEDAQCDYCSKKISRGKSKKDFGHNGMKNHLKTHPTVNAEFLRKEKANIEEKPAKKNEIVSKQDTLSQSSAEVEMQKYLGSRYTTLV